MRGVALDRLDEVRDQVPAPLQLHLDLRPRVVDAVPQPDEAVVEHCQPEGQQGQHDQRHDRPGHAATLLRSPAAYTGPVLAGEALLTTVVGSYPQPDWLIDRERLGDRLPPRVRARELWRVAEPLLEEAQDDATRLAVQDMERAGVDVITDGEMRRESYSNRFATALDGIDLDEPGVALDRTGHPNPVPKVVGPIRRARPGGGARRRVPALPHRSPDQDHRPGSVHDDAAGPERPLPGRAQPRAGLRGGGQRGATRPEGRGRRRRPDRRAVPAGSPRARARVRAGGDRPRPRGDRGRHGPAHLLRLRAHRPRPARAATRSCAS